MSPAVETRASSSPDDVGFETFLADLAARLITLDPGEIDDTIVEAERQVCEFLGLDIAVLWQWCDS
ncbi:MAG: hypothetical protein V2I67_05480, partial [Thermoanaerobaculales bacterium]|nr:hypothetical protein [Thermoanaerobaculales bacterium]